MRRFLPLLALGLLAPPPGNAARGADEPKKAPEQFEVPYRLTIPKHILVRAKINGKGPFNFILDTGAPTTTLHEGKELRVPDALLVRPDPPTRLRSGARFRFVADGTTDDDAFELELVAGRVPGIDRIDVAARENDGFVNLGLIPFLRHDVFFDVERGLVGFAPCRAGDRQVAVRRGSGVRRRH